LPDKREKLVHQSRIEQTVGLWRGPTEKKQQHPFAKAQKQYILVWVSKFPYRFRFYRLYCFFQDVDRLEQTLPPAKLPSCVQIINDVFL